MKCVSCGNLISEYRTTCPICCSPMKAPTVNPTYMNQPLNAESSDTQELRIENFAGEEQMNVEHLVRHALVGGDFKLRNHAGQQDPLPFIDNEEEEKQVFSSGAQRGTDVKLKYHLLSPIAMRRWAEAYTEGATKYGHYNCEKGFPIHDILDHAINHLLKYLARDTTEDHLGHAFWNIGMAMHTEETRPEMMYGLRPKWAIEPTPVDKIPEDVQDKLYYVLHSTDIPG